VQIRIRKNPLSRALTLALLGFASGVAFAQVPDKPDGDGTGDGAGQADTSQKQKPGDSRDAKPSELGEVSVTGYRRSIQYSTEAKRAAVNVTDTVFAEDIGKFPDLNIAESLARIPGIQLARDVNGEGLNIAIRGLPTSFTKITLNGNSVATASIGLNAQNQNREVDLNLFPTELFTQLTVNKSPKASLMEGGAAGVVDLRPARPFDRPGTHFTYSAQVDHNSISDKYSPTASVIGSWTNDSNTVGALLGLATVRGHIGVQGWESIGWTNPGLSYTQCGLDAPAGVDPNTNRPGACNAGGGGNWLIPITVPNNRSTVAAGLTPGATIDANLLRSLNPGLDIPRLTEALIPRLGRPVNMSGTRNRDAVLGTFEWRPSDSAHFYLDTMFAKAHRTNDRIDINLVGRNFGASGLIPIDLQLDENNVVTHGTFANAQFFLEARPYREDVKYWNVNPGGTFWFGDNGNIKLDVQGHASRSWMFRESPTILVNSPYTWTTDLDLNDPNLGWTWTGGRVNVQNERRQTETNGVMANLQFGGDQRNINVGVVYDTNKRRIQGFDNSAAWQTYVLSQISDGQLPNFLMPGPYGFITADFQKFQDATNYTQYRDSAPESGGPNTGASTGGISEDNKAAFVEFNGESDVLDRPLRFNAGVRWITTDQDISGPVTIAGVRQWQVLRGTYSDWLPSMNAAWDVASDVVLRMSGSRTLTRPNPSSMLPNTLFTDPSAQQASQGNPNLKPYISNNFDLAGEWYTGGEGLVALTLFNKSVEGYTYLGTNTIPFSQLGISFDDLTDGQKGAINARGGPNSATVTVQQQVNANAKLNIRGWEALWIQPLGFVVDGLGFQANYTHLNLGARGQDAARLASNLYGIAPKLWNTTLYYDHDRISARLSYNFTDGYTTSGNNQNGIPYAQLKGVKHSQLDFSASYTLDWIASKPQVTLNVVNITNEKLQSLFWWPNATNDYYNPGRTILLGIRGTF
jgi:TonB-dependent receptor